MIGQRLGAALNVSSEVRTLLTLAARQLLLLTPISSQRTTAQLLFQHSSICHLPVNTLLRDFVASPRRSIEPCYTSHETTRMHYTYKDPHTA